MLYSYNDQWPEEHNNEDFINYLLDTIKSGGTVILHGPREELIKAGFQKLLDYQDEVLNDD